MTFAPITGRDPNVTVADCARRIDVEALGQGRAVRCLPNGRARSAERHPIENAARAAGRRSIAVDMPRHGKPLPPLGCETEGGGRTTPAGIQTMPAVSDAPGPLSTRDRPAGVRPHFPDALERIS